MAFGQKVIVRCPPRCLVSSWKPAPRWSGGSVTTVAPLKLAPEWSEISLRILLTPLVWPENAILSLWPLFHFLCIFLWVLLLFPLVRPVSSWRMGWSPSLSTTISRKDWPRWPRPKSRLFIWTWWCILCRLKQEIQSRWQLVTDWWDSGYSKQLLMRVDDCLAQLFIYTRFAKLGLAIFIGMTSSLPSFSFFSSSLEISIHPYSSWNFLFCSQHIIKYFVHKYPNFYLVMSGSCENLWKFCCCHINFNGVKIRCSHVIIVLFH